MKKEDFMKVVRSKAKETLTEQEENFFAGIGDAVETAFTQETAERNKQIKDITDKLGIVDEGKSISEVIRTLATAIDTLEAKSKRTFGDAERFNLRKKLEDKKEEIQRSMKSGNLWEVQFHAKRAASALMTTSTVLTGASAVNNPNVYDDMDVVVIQYPKNFILDAVTSRLVSKVPQTMQWKEQATAGDGVPAATNEGAAKPLTDKTFVWKYATRKKYAGSMKMTEEVEIDFEQLVIDIINMFENDVIIAWNDGVLADIVAWADTYTTTVLDGTIPNPTVHTVIGAGKLHVQDNNHEPDVICINGGDVAKMMYSQDNNGNLMFVPIELQFAGLTPFISNKIAAGKILIGKRQTIQEQHSAFIIRKGTVGDQFIENESTIVGEVFSILKLSTLAQPSWIYLDIATVAAALQKV